MNFQFYFLDYYSSLRLFLKIHLEKFIQFYHQNFKTIII